jgi:hypothetical protein
VAAPKHNLFALGNNGGRPRKYETAEEMELKINEYFNWCIENKMEIAVNGLVLYLGFSHKSSLYEYQENEEFTDLIKKARTAVEMSYELDLRTFKFGGAVFALKNMGWTDVTTQNVNQTVTNVEASFGTTISTPQQSGEDTPFNKE